MRLTKADKSAFVAAVMDDVPQVDYHEMVRKVVQQWCFDALPEKLKPLVKRYPDYFDMKYVCTPYGCPGVYCICPPELSHYKLENEHPDKWARLVKLGELHMAQASAHSEFRTKVQGLINTCTTLKQAQERLPEFVKYLPADRNPTALANLPVANTPADLQAAGWPKGEAPCNS